MSEHSDGAAALHQRAQKFMDTLPEGVAIICVSERGNDIAFSMHGCDATKALQLAAIACRSAYTIARNAGMSGDEAGVIFDTMVARMTGMTEQDAPKPRQPNPARN